MPPKKPPQDVHAIAFFNSAREYHEAANELFTIADARPKIHGSRQLSQPLYFLYFHTIELALKAFLRANNLPILKTREIHELANLYRECGKLGLVLGPHDKFQIGNIVSLLDSANKYQGIRYFNLESGSTAELSWVREVTAELMRAVEPHVRTRAQQDNLLQSRAAKKLTVVFPNPRPKTDA
jgi:hypothetical protein